MEITYRKDRVLSVDGLEIIFTKHPEYSSSVTINTLTPQEFEGAVLELANKIMMDRVLKLGATPRGSQMQTPKIIYAPSDITIAHLEQLLDIIQKLVDK